LFFFHVIIRYVTLILCILQIDKLEVDKAAKLEIQGVQTCVPMESNANSGGKL
jgi:hypothetical protein